MLPMLYNDDFRRKLVVYVVKKVKKQSYSRICCYLGVGVGGGGGCDDGGSGLGGGGCVGGNSGGGGGEIVGSEGKIENGVGIGGWWWNLSVMKAKSRVVILKSRVLKLKLRVVKPKLRVVKEFEGG